MNLLYRHGGQGDAKTQPVGRAGSTDSVGYRFDGKTKPVSANIELATMAFLLIKKCTRRKAIVYELDEV